MKVVESSEQKDRMGKVTDRIPRVVDRVVELME